MSKYVPVWAIVVIGTHAALADCPKEWATGFHAPGVTGTVNAMAVFDDGSGPALYVGGDFDAAGEARCRYVAEWDGIHWSAVGPESSWLVYSLIVFDDGDGPALRRHGVRCAAVERGGVAARSRRPRQRLGSGRIR